MKYQFGPFWSIFGLITSWQRAISLKFWDNDFKNEYFASMLYYRLSSFYHYCYMKYKFGLLLACGLMKSPPKLKLQYFEKVISETNSFVQSSIKFHHSIRFRFLYTLYTWYTTLDPFYAIWRQWHNKINKYSKVLN